MLRLTLRTLLAYLDDTLEPAQAKGMGKKVAESEFAQETVERIKTVTRRRRLSAPTVFADDYSTDPNTIAEYLDNVLPPDQVTLLEEAALENDLRLAEVAACHQILTLVLGEPAKIPPAARRRMYRLVTGPESLPYRQPVKNTPIAGIAAPAEVDEYADHEDDLLTTFLGPRKLLWLLSLLIAVSLLVVAIWLAVPKNPPQPFQGYIAMAPARVEPNPTPTPSPSLPAPRVVVTPEPELKPPMPEVLAPDFVGPPPREINVGPVQVKPPDSERRVVATYDTPTQPLLFLKRETIRWEKIDPRESRVSSTDIVLALPGFHPAILTESGVRIQMWGSVYEHLPLPLAESRLALAVPAIGIDAEITLFGGRIFLTAPKATKPTVVRVRFRNEVWDVTLANRETEVAIDLVGEPSRGPLFNRDLPESPRALVYLGVVQGIASVRSGFLQSGDLGGGTKWKWDSKGGPAAQAPENDADEVGIPNRWTKQVPTTAASKEAVPTITEMALRIGRAQAMFDIDLNATLKDPKETIGRRVLSTWMLGSMDSLSYLIDALEADSTPVRDAAAKTIRHWIAQHPSRDAIFQEELAMKIAFNENQRANIIGLVRGTERPPTAVLMEQLFDLLINEKLAVRELARMQLASIDPAGQKSSNYDAASDRSGAQMSLWKANWKQKMKGKGKE